MKSIVFGLIMGLLIGSASVSKEYISPWRSISFVAELPAPYGEARVSIDRTGIDSDSRIKSMSINLNDQEVAVPTALFSDLPKPQIQTVELTSEIGGGRETNGIYINFQYGDRALNGKGDFPSASIILLNGKVVSRSIKKQTSQSSWKFDDKP